MSKKLPSKEFERELRRLQVELVLLQEYIKAKGLKVVVVFEGRDAAGKGGVIKRIAERTSPRHVRVVALATPTEREKTQWYFQRYVAHLPAAGEMVLFDRSWYNRAGVERVMGFCTDDEYAGVHALVPGVRADARALRHHLIKYWFSRLRRGAGAALPGPDPRPDAALEAQPDGPASRARSGSSTRGPRTRCSATPTSSRRPGTSCRPTTSAARRLNCISHLLSQIDYEDVTPPPLELPPRQPDTSYVRPPMDDQTFVPAVF